MNAQEREENKQAVSNVITEKAHIESYNRFKELQKQYSQPFNYSSSKAEVYVHCQVSYLPYECRIDKVSFELMLLQTQPKNLVILNSSPSKVQEIERFLLTNRIETQLHS